MSDLTTSFHGPPRRWLAALAAGLTPPAAIPASTADGCPVMLAAREATRFYGRMHTDTGSAR